MFVLLLVDLFKTLQYVCLSVCRYVGMSVYRFVCLLVYLFICLFSFFVVLNARLTGRQYSAIYLCTIRRKTSFHNHLLIFTTFKFFSFYRVSTSATSIVSNRVENFSPFYWLLSPFHLSIDYLKDHTLLFITLPN